MAPGIKYILAEYISRHFLTIFLIQYGIMKVHKIKNPENCYGEISSKKKNKGVLYWLVQEESTMKV